MTKCREEWELHMEAEDLPKKKPQIILGEPLDQLSIAELTQRIEALESEIGRVKAAIVSKQASRNAADAFFKS
jgi:uncharacterized small protein (DUF1192 family)